MADDPNPALRAELIAAQKVLAPQIRGLHDLVATSISADLAAAINQQIIVRERRRDLIQAALDRLDAVVDARTALEADGYPTLPGSVIEPDLFKELQGENSDLDAAVAVFKEDIAANISVTLGAPTPKT